MKRSSLVVVLTSHPIRKTSALMAGVFTVGALDSKVFKIR